MQLLRSCLGVYKVLLLLKDGMGVKDEKFG